MNLQSVKLIKSTLLQLMVMLPVCLADIDGVDYDTGVKIIEAIAKGLIHNVKVSY